MWRWVVLWQASGLLLVSGFLDFGFFSQKSPQFEPSTQVNCYEYPDPKMDRYMKMFNEGWRYTKAVPRQFIALPTSAIYSVDTLLNTNDLLTRKTDRLLPETDDVVKEHAKLVQDINGLKQLVFISPFRDETRDYDDSIFNEIIETSTTSRPSSAKPYQKSKSSSIPIILLGGASQRQIVKSQPLQFHKPTINLVGTTSNPLLRHPYPFVIQSSTKKPVKLCMSSIGYTTKRPSLWSRLINSIIPR